MEKYVVLQQDRRDCGVACLLSVIRYHGGDNTFENLRRLSGTTLTGTTLLGLQDAAKTIGFDAEGFEADINTIQQYKASILHVVTENSTHHYITYLDTVNVKGESKLMFSDPARGLVYLTEEELEDIWRSKCCLVLTPTEQFQKVKDVYRKRRKWIQDLLKDDWPLLSIATGLGIVISVIGLAMAVFSQRLIDEILPQKDVTRLTIGITTVFVLLLAKEGLSVIRQYTLFRQYKEFNIRIVTFFFSRLLQLPKTFYETRKIGELIARLNDTSRIQKVISQLAGNIIIDALVVIVSSIFIFIYSWQLGIACLLLMPCYYYLIHAHSKRIRMGQQAIMRGYAETESNYVSMLQGIDIIKNHNKQALFSSINQSVYRSYQERVISLGKVQVKLSVLANIFSAIFLIGVLLFESFQVLNNQLTIGELVAILTMCSSLLPGIANVALVSVPLNEAKIAFDRMYEFAGINPEDDRGHLAVTSLESLRTEQIAFRFPGYNQLLKNISFDVKKGEIVAIMGESGSGKSTLLQLIQKNYHPNGGQILINDSCSIKDIACSAWRSLVGIVPQHIHLFNGSIIENIAFDDVGIKSGQVIQFLQQAGFLSYFQNLPNSIMTLVGEEGIGLSGGQKQLVAIARALYHRPQLLILDEATSAMDKQMECSVLELLTTLKKEMAIILTTHRLHVLKKYCDRIYILEKGHIIQHGKHEQLLQSKNLYSQYWADLRN